MRQLHENSAAAAWPPGVTLPSWQQVPSKACLHHLGLSVAHSIGKCAIMVHFETLFQFKLSIITILERLFNAPFLCRQEQHIFAIFPQTLHPSPANSTQPHPTRTCEHPHRYMTFGLVVIRFTSSSKASRLNFLFVVSTIFSFSPATLCATSCVNNLKNGATSRGAQICKHYKTI